MQELTPSVYQGIRERASRLLRRYGDFADAPETISLFNRAYLKLDGGNAAPPRDRDHVFAIWHRAMHSILTDLFRRARLVRKTPIDERRDEAAPSYERRLELLHDALRDLARDHKRAALIVELRYFDGCKWVEIAEALTLSRYAIEKEWGFASAWLRRELARRGFEDEATEESTP